MCCQSQQALFITFYWLDVCKAYWLTYRVFFWAKIKNHKICKVLKNIPTQVMLNQFLHYIVYLNWPWNQKKIIMIASLENVVSHSKKRNVDTQELLTSAPRHHVRLKNGTCSWWNDSEHSMICCLTLAQYWRLHLCNSSMIKPRPVLKPISFKCISWRRKCPCRRNYRWSGNCSS